jgi:hypothetical protein
MAVITAHDTQLTLILETTLVKKLRIATHINMEKMGLLGPTESIFQGKVRTFSADPILYFLIPLFF